MRTGKEIGAGELRPSTDAWQSFPPDERKVDQCLVSPF